MPVEFSLYPLLLIDESGRTGLDIPDEVRQGNCRCETDEYVNMVWHAIDRKHFLVTVSNDTGEVFVQFFLVFSSDKTQSVPHCEHDLHVDLRVGVGH